MDHTIKEKKAYKSNKDIKPELIKNNIELAPLTEKYVKGFKLKVKDYENEHQMQIKTERAERKKLNEIVLMEGMDSNFISLIQNFV